MGIFGFGKNKDKDNSNEVKEAAGDLSEEMRILNEVEEETEAERFARAEAGRLATEAVAQKRQDAEDMAMRASGEYIDLAGDDRFYLVVDDIPGSVSEVPGGFVVSGIVRGKICRGMDVFVYHANKKTVTSTKVVSLSIAGKKFDEVTDERVVIDLEKGDLPDATTPDEDIEDPVDKFSVITNVMAHETEDPEVGPDNPKLLGLTMEYARFDSDKVFFETLAEAFVHSEFITPVQMSRAGGNKRNIGLMSLKDNEDRTLFPIFTDKICLNRNRPKSIKIDPSNTIAMNFPEAAAIGMRGGHQGILINPFGPVTVRLPLEALQGITGSAAFKREFGDAVENTSVEEVLGGAGARVTPIEKQVEVTLAPPPEAGEYRFMREAIRKYCGAHSDIVKVGIILQTEKDNNARRAYLCVMDCPEERLPEHFKAIVKLCRPFMKAVKEMGAIPIAQAPFAEQYFSQNEYTYNKLMG
ncbi:MAG: SseB family protein [Clostridiales bacterium]|nr:SseB family protein [Clostridiales bacterium]